MTLSGHPEALGSLAKPSAAAAIPWAAAAVFFLILACRLHIVARVGSAIPFWDEWDSDSIGIFLPPDNGLPGLTDLFRYHNEHLIFLTRLYDLLLFWGEGGRLSARTAEIINQIIVALSASFFLLRIACTMPDEVRLPFLMSGCAILANPFGVDAQFWGFESQIYFCIILSVLAFWLLACNNPDDRGFWWGVAAAAVTPLSFAVGHATIAAAIALIVIRQVRGSYRVTAAAAVFGLTVLLVVSATCAPVQGDLELRGRAISMLMTALRVLSWPCSIWFPLLPYLPSLALLTAGLQGARPRDTLFWFTLAIVVWQGLIAGEITLGRSTSPLESRYTEIFAVGIALNIACLFSLAEGSPVGSPRYRLILAIAWIAVLAFDYASRVPALHDAITGRRAQDDAEEAIVTRYLKSRDQTLLLPPATIPYHTPALLALRLDQGEKAGIFPRAFLKGDAPRHGKWRKTINHVAGFLAVAGLACGLAALSRVRRTPRPNAALAGSTPP